MIWKMLAATGTAALVAGCGGGGGGGGGAGGGPDDISPLEALDAALLEQAAVFQAVRGYGPTRIDSMPDTGQAVYTGYAEVRLPAGAGNLDYTLTLLGDLRMTADFAAYTVTGDITDVLGYIGDLPATDASVFATTGHIPIGGGGGLSQIGDAGGNGVLDEPLPANEWSATFDGILGSPLGDLQVYGVATGTFQGTRRQAPDGLTIVPAISGSGVYTSVTIDDVIATGDISIRAVD